MSEDPVERPRDVVEIERLDEVLRVADLAPAAAAHEAAELLLDRSALPLRLLLQRAEGAEVAVRFDDLLDRVDTERADQLFLKICIADVEAEPFQIVARQVRAEPGPLETATEVALLRGVAQTGQPHVESLGAEPVQEPADRLRASDRQHGDALGVEVPTATPREGFDRVLIADPFDEHDRTRVGQRYIRSIIARPKPDEETSFASSISRAKS